MKTQTKKQTASLRVHLTKITDSVVRQLTRSLPPSDAGSLLRTSGQVEKKSHQTDLHKRCRKGAIVSSDGFCDWLTSRWRLSVSLGMGHKRAGCG